MACALLASMSERNPPSQMTTGADALACFQRRSCGHSAPEPMSRNCGSSGLTVNLIHDRIRAESPDRCIHLLREACLPSCGARCLRRHRRPPAPPRALMRQPAAFSFAQSDATPLVGRTILQIVPELDAGGAERTAVDIAAGLAACRRAGARRDVGRAAGRRAAGQGRHLDPLPGRDQEPLRACSLNARRLRSHLPRRGRGPDPCPLARAGLGRAWRRAVAAACPSSPPITAAMPAAPR